MPAIWDKIRRGFGRAPSVPPPPPVGSPVADLPYDEAVAATAAMIEEWRMTQPVFPDLELGLPQPKMKPWYYGCIGGVPIHTLIHRTWTSTRDGIRTNRYMLPARLYATLWLSLLAASLGLFAVGIPEGLEAVSDQQKAMGHHDYRGPVCGPFPRGRFYRIMARQMANTLPLLVTLTIFFFPAIVRP
ncbi:uncharacterized protein M421DRAFT_9404 [Didymella exigua CBS 183.55]|uniref:Uncharacterized protein n=1 Tax=Didymella exigua CBS 183.55 TaxID=1150837 RepID=A0A6A5R9V0_9PLEO|nr:uncharacterized protein M421DRAFT_9404 [Didymella exigua CBS 183.55]KAF1923794.1 hypothetical protein M421DRAFT_9404 [Didymella exigua CBS 183.55]